MGKALWRLLIMGNGENCGVGIERLLGKKPVEVKEDGESLIEESMVL